MPKHLPLLNFMQELHSRSQECMIFLLDYLALFLGGISGMLEVWEKLNYLRQGRRGRERLLELDQEV
jgi:hypothetical protein